MKLSLCPRCDLNYITESEKYCRICMQEMHSSGNRNETELCSICNENPVLPGKDVCAICFREMNGDTSDHDDTNDDGSVNANDIAGMDSVAEMDEIIPDMEDDGISSEEFAKIESEEKEFGDIENPISLEEEREREEGDDKDSDDEDDQ